ncbi:MAG: dTDP-4-dehydrorhamnose 3,5-epimerase [Pirellulales bacterium]
MLFSSTAIDGVFLIRPDYQADDRGGFARTWCRKAFTQRGLESELAQCNLSFNKCRGTVRGLHFQRPPHAETKLVRCTRGAIYDVAVDLRRDQSTFLSWVAFELTEDNHQMLYIPEYCAHGFQTLRDRTEVCYQMSTPYHAESASGIGWNDPAVAIAWPIRQPILSARDRSWPPVQTNPHPLMVV